MVNVQLLIMQIGYVLMSSLRKRGSIAPLEVDSRFRGNDKGVRGSLKRSLGIVSCS